MFQLAVAMQKLLAPVIRSPEQLDPLSARSSDKGNGHFAFQLDLLAHDALGELLTRHGFRGKVFSEEGGAVQDVGSGEDLLICDPYDNTSLTVNGFRESAVALTLVDRRGEFKAAAIADLQIDRIIWANSDVATQVVHRTRAGAWHMTPARASTRSSLDEARVAVSLMKQKRRLQGNPDLRLIPLVGTLFSLDGALMIARVAIGELEAYVDSYIGQPIYEIPCCELIRRAGGVVTDAAGEEFSLPDLVAELRRDPTMRQNIVCASNPTLHAFILDVLAR